jgi:hypothetical protein
MKVGDRHPSVERPEAYEALRIARYCTLEELPSLVFSATRAYILMSLPQAHAVMGANITRVRLVRPPSDSSSASLIAWGRHWEGDEAPALRSGREKTDRKLKSLRGHDRLA